MTRNNQQATWSEWILQRGFWTIVIGLGLVAALLVGAASYLDRRLETIENQIAYVPASNYAPPNLDDYAAADYREDEMTVEQLVYVPVYSHIYYEGGAPYLLETTLSLRNVDVDSPVFVKVVDYYNTQGKLAKSYLDRTIRLGPLETIEFLVARRDTTGGSGANFLVEWASQDDVNEPLIEAVMVGTNGMQAVCFSRQGVAISSREGE